MGKVSGLFQGREGVAVGVGVVTGPDIDIMSFLVYQTLCATAVNPPVRSVIARLVSTVLSTSSGPRADVTLLPMSPVPLLN